VDGQSLSDFLSGDGRLIQKLKARGIEVTLIHPEDVVLDMLAPELRRISARASEKDESGKISICLVGGKNGHSALASFAKAIEDAHPSIKVQINARGILGDVHGAAFDSLSEEDRKLRRQQMLRESALTIVYGLTDAETADLANATVSNCAFNPTSEAEEEQQLLCIVETPSGRQEVAEAHGFAALPVYEGLRERIFASSGAKTAGRRHIAA
jgi:hypothetical protein